MSLQFEPDYFNIKSLGTRKIFKTGNKPLKNLLIIDRSIIIINNSLDSISETN